MDLSPLKILLNLSLREDNILEDLRPVEFLSVHVSGQYNRPENFRALGLLSIMPKVMKERV